MKTGEKKNALLLILLLTSGVCLVSELLGPMQHMETPDFVWSASVHFAISSGAFVLVVFAVCGRRWMLLFPAAVCFFADTFIGGGSTTLCCCILCLLVLWQIKREAADCLPQAALSTYLVGLAFALFSALESMNQMQGDNDLPFSLADSFFLPLAQLFMAAAIVVLCWGMKRKRNGIIRLAAAVHLVGEAMFFGFYLFMEESYLLGILSLPFSLATSPSFLLSLVLLFRKTETARESALSKPFNS